MFKVVFLNEYDMANLKKMSMPILKFESSSLCYYSDISFLVTQTPIH